MIRPAQVIVGAKLPLRPSNFIVGIEQMPITFAAREIQ